MSIAAGQRWTHVKRGTEYEVLGVGELQCSANAALDGAMIVIYRGDDGKLWSRGIDEFTDGRFRLAALASAPAGDGVFQMGDAVEKISGSSWRGKVVGFYSTSLTPEGYAVESETETGSVQIYPAKALRLARPRAAVGERRDLLDALASMVKKPWSSSEAGDWVLDEAARLLSALQSPLAKE